MKKERGVTLVALMITIVLMAILIGTVVNYGGSSLDAARFQNFSYELQQIQGKVDTICEKIKLGDESYITLGSNITASSEAMNTLDMVKGINYSNLTDSQRADYYYKDMYTYYRYLTEDDLETYLDITSDPGDVIINFKTKEVISVEGFRYNDRTYYTLDEIQ